MLLATALVNVPVRGQQNVLHRDTLVGELLIAPPSMVDPVFQHSVILIFHHDESGTLGIIINHPVEVRPLASVVKAIGGIANGIEGNVHIFAGGPMEPEIGFVLHSTDYHGAGTVDIDGNIAMTTRPQIFSDIGHQKGPKRYIIAFGYAGWGPGQLEVELARHDWFTATEDPTLVFDDDRAKVWQDALARRGRAI